MNVCKNTLTPCKNTVTPDDPMQESSCDLTMSKVICYWSVDFWWFSSANQC